MPSIIPILLTAIEEDGFHLMIDVEVNGISARMLIDTGASRSVFDLGRIQKFFAEKDPEMEDNEQLSTGLGTREMQSQAVWLKEFKLGELIIKNYPAVVIDMSHVNHSYQELKLDPIDGVLGSDILVKYGAVIDYKKMTMRINKRKFSRKLVNK